MGFVIVMAAMFILLIAAGGGFLVCWIVVVRRVFEHEGRNAGFISIIFPPLAWLHGWKRASEWKIWTVMVLWTMLWCPAILVLVIVMARMLE